MANINLLPWRENLRAQRKREFGVMTLVFVLITGIGLWGWQQFNQGLIDNQKRRNQFLENEISKVNEQIKEIRSLEKTRKQLIARMKVVASLQSSRPQIVHLFDELVTTIPDGVHLTSVSQSGKGVSVNGWSESNARVSAYMRAVEASPWLSNPNLKVIEKGKGKSDQKGDNAFTLSMTQVVPKVGDKK